MLKGVGGQVGRSVNIGEANHSNQNMYLKETWFKSQKTQFWAPSTLTCFSTITKTSSPSMFYFQYLTNKYIGDLRSILINSIQKHSLNSYYIYEIRYKVGTQHLARKMKSQLTNRKQETNKYVNQGGVTGRKHPEGMWLLSATCTLSALPCSSFSFDNASGDFR